jgi:hypothetical protein
MPKYREWNRRGGVARRSSISEHGLSARRVIVATQHNAAR